MNKACLHPYSYRKNLTHCLFGVRVCDQLPLQFQGFLGSFGFGFGFLLIPSLCFVPLLVFLITLTSITGAVIRYSPGVNDVSMALCITLTADRAID